VAELVPVPEGLDTAEAVCLVLNYVVAHQMLHRVARVARGARILVHGAAGGVGTAFLEVGQLAGLERYGTASRPKHALVAHLGASPVGYWAEDFVARIGVMTGGVGVDAVLYPIGAAHLRQSMQAVRSGGTVVGYGFYAAAKRGSNNVLDVLSHVMHVTLEALRHSARAEARRVLGSTPQPPPRVPEGAARAMVWTVDARRGVAWVARRPPLKRSAPASKGRGCCSPWERVTTEPANSMQLGKVQAVQLHILPDRHKSGDPMAHTGESH
jgi:NADPH:quinone reductase-like Zn-dependent oxidoreductase